MKNFKFLKVILVTFISILFIPYFVGAESSGFDKQLEIDLTENHEVDFEKSFDELVPQSEYGTLNFNLPIPISGRTILDLAEGKSTMSFTKTTASGKGTTKGLRLTTVSSVTNATKNYKSGSTNTGSKSWRIGKLTSTSTSSVNKSSGYNQYATISFHTATHQGVLYEARTGRAGYSNR